MPGSAQGPASVMHQRKLEFASALKSNSQPATCDFTIVCTGATFPVHRLVLSMHSTYFKRLCEGSFKESTERMVILREDPTPAVKALVQYLYEFNYDNPMNHVPDSYDSFPYPQNTLEAHAQEFTVADKYDIPGLKDLAVAKFKYLMDRSDKKYTFEAEDLLKATPYIYRHSPPSDDRFRLALVNAWGACGGRRLEHANKDDFEALLREVPELASDLISGLAGVAVGRLATAGHK